MHRMLSIELVGLPGAGKTTLHTPLIQILSEYGAVVDGYKWSRNLCRDPRVWVRETRTLMSHLSPHGLRLAMTYPGRRLLRACLRQHIAIRRAHAEGATFCLFQEGATHEAWRLHFSRKLELDSALVRRIVRIPDLTVFLEVSPEAARRRIRGKITPGPINRILAEASLGSCQWDRAVDAYNRIRDISNDGREIMIANDTDESQSLSSNQIAQRIASHIIAAI